MKIQKILVPVDFSSHSAEAVRFAADLARRYEASIELLHAFHIQTYAMPEGYVVPTQEHLELIEQQLEGQLAGVKKAALEAGASRVETKLVRGRPVSEIVRVVQDEKVDMIVMGTHGHTGVKHLLIGSVAENVVRDATCPVLIVRAHS